MFVNYLLKPRIGFLVRNRMLTNTMSQRACFATTDIPEADFRPLDDAMGIDEDQAFQEWLNEGVPEQFQKGQQQEVGKGALRAKRNPFYKLGFNEHHIPHQGGYEKLKAKKPRLE